MRFRVLFAILLTAALTASSYAAESPEDFLRGLYKVHLARWKKDIYWFDKRKELEKYFDADLTLLFLKDEQCKEKTQEVCNLEFDPILDAQDFDERVQFQLKVQKIPHKTKVRYKVTFTNGAPKNIIYELIETPAGWRITDIIYSEGSPLKQILSAKY
jgi:hypothetical protein